MKRLLCTILALMLLGLCASAAAETVTFGSYEQSYPGEPISWLVLTSGGSTTVLMSEYALDCRSYDKKTSKWEKSKIRDWLNYDFYYEAFTADERKALIANRDGDYVTLPTLGDVTNTAFGFAESHKAADSTRATGGTAYAVDQGLWRSRELLCSYFLRTPAYDDVVYQVRTDGTVGIANVTRENVGIRMMIYVQSDALTGK